MGFALRTLAIVCSTWWCGEVDFDPRRDLPGFREVDAVNLEFHFLFELERFEAAKGKRPEPEVARLRDEWTSIRDRALARIREIESDPRAAAEFAFDKAFRIEVGKHFPNREFEAAETPRSSAAGEPKATKLGIEIRYQVPRSAEKFYGEAIGKNYGLMTDALVRHFESEYVEPLGLAPRADSRPFLALVVLEDRAAYEKLFVAKTHAEPSFVRAHYDPLRRMAFSYEPGTQELTKEKQQAVLHEMTHALLDAYLGVPGRRLPLWLNEGLAEYLSHCHGHVATTNFVFGAKPERAMLELDDFFSQEDTPYLFSIEDLFRVEEYSDAASILAARAAAKGKEIDPRVALAVLYKQSHVLVWWLDRHAGPESTTKFRAYLAKALQGDGGFEAFRSAFAFCESVDFDRRFVEAIREVPRLGSAPSESGEPVRATPKSRFATIAFDLAPASDSVKRGAAFKIAREGDPNAALATARANGLKSADLDFLSKLAAMVDGVLAGLARSGNSISLVVGRKADGTPENVQGKVIRFDEKTIVLLRSSNKQEYSIDRARYGAREALQHASKAGFDASQLDRGRVIGLLGSDDPKRLSALGVKKSELGAHAAAIADVESALDAAEIRGLLEEFATLANRVADADAEPVLERIEDLTSRFAGHHEVVAHRASLRDFAGQLLEQVHRTGRRNALGFAGALTALDDGRFELRYSFDSAGDAADFENLDFRPGWLADRPKIPPVPASVRDGAAGLRGYSALAHRARFAGDFEVEYEFRIATEGAAQIVAYFGDLDAARFVYVPFAAEATVFHGAANARSKPLVSLDELKLDQKERVKIEQREGRLRVSCRDKVAEFDSAIRDSNRLLFLTVKSVAEVRIEEVVVRGNFDPKWFEKESASAIDAALTALFPH